MNDECHSKMSDLVYLGTDLSQGLHLSPVVEKYAIKARSVQDQSRDMTELFKLTYW